MLPVCLVSFNSTIRRVQSFIFSYCGFKFTSPYNLIRSVVFSAMLRLLVINTSSSYPVNIKRLRLPPMSVTKLLQSGAAMCITLDGRSVHNMRWSRRESRFLPTLPAFDALVKWQKIDPQSFQDTSKIRPLIGGVQAFASTRPRHNHGLQVQPCYCQSKSTWVATSLYLCTGIKYTFL